MQVHLIDGRRPFLQRRVARVDRLFLKLLRPVFGRAGAFGRSQAILPSLLTSGIVAPNRNELRFRRLARGPDDLRRLLGRVVALELWCVRARMR